MEQSGRQGTGGHSGISLDQSAQLIVIDLGGPPRPGLILEGPVARAKPGEPSATHSFDVSHVNSHKNYHRRYSVQGQKNPRSYSHVVEANGDQYAFLAVDAAMFPGLKSPHNFFGIIAPDEWQKVLTLESEIPKDAYKIFFGHYPSSVIVSPSPGIQSLLSKGLVYLCGHLHTLGGLIHHMYALQPLGNLELELADWKFSRRFRVAAIDHGLFSFVDHTMSEWPIILVTNPKDNSLSSPLKEPLHLMQNSTHVRVLVFSLQGVERIRVKVASGSWVTAVHTNGPLYVVPWDLLLWNQSVKGTLLLHVEAVEKDGNSRTVSQPFSLDGTYSQTSFGARFVLRTNMLKMWLRKIWLMTTLNMIFYPLVILLLYTAIGPIFGGELIEGYYGVGFAWGIYVGPWYVPGSQSFTIGFLHEYCICMDGKVKDETLHSPTGDTYSCSDATSKIFIMFAEELFCSSDTIFCPSANADDLRMHFAYSSAGKNEPQSSLLHNGTVMNCLILME
ncbi:unnamed protein product [Darwinula stevensoni]|uniref:TMEM62 Ig-like domain-containing protein n=1 Tax=Darwinula stevensoni TaxID=69355 RepID=A0A7R8X0E3_9CRUS|nr:unnamed protein product [Darwinula stevensoni]CAG0878722.1 unnamed protein product [Darwinula stevensoni]